MKRMIFLVVCVCIGCQPEVATPPSSNPADDKPNSTFPIDYAQWPQLTDEPTKVPARVAEMCMAPAAPRPAAYYGPHIQDSNGHSVRYFINPSSEAAFHKEVVPMPVGTTIVKEKWQSRKENERGSLTSLAAMVKREPGFAKEHWDWEYLYAEMPDAGKPMMVTRGQIATCVECHAREWEKDYLFHSIEMWMHGAKSK